jgi:hypothetical protein
MSIMDYLRPQTRARDIPRGHIRGPPHGVPITIKDNMSGNQSHSQSLRYPSSPSGFSGELTQSHFRFIYVATRVRPQGF